MSRKAMRNLILSVFLIVAGCVLPGVVTADDWYATAAGVGAVSDAPDSGDPGGGRFQDADTPGSLPADDAVVTPGEPPIVNDPVEVNPNVLMWQTILAVFASLSTSAISRAFPLETDADRLRRGVALALVCVAAAFVDTLIRGVFNTSNYLASFLVIGTVAIGFYKGWAKTTTVAARIEGRPRVE